MVSPSTVEQGPTRDGAQCADVIVDPSGVADAITITAGLLLLPAAGGSICIASGTYDVGSGETFPLTLPDKPVKFFGSGRGNTIIDIEGAAVAAFDIGFDNEYDFSDFTIEGDESAGQIAFDHTLGSIAANTLSVSRVDTGFNAGRTGASGGIETTFDFTTGCELVVVSECQFQNNTLAGRRFINGGTSSFTINSVRAMATIDAVASDVYATDCRFENIASAVGFLTSSAQESKFEDCDFRGLLAAGVVSFGASTSEFTGCTFNTSISSSGGTKTFTGCRFNSAGVQVNHMDVGAAASVVVTGCRFGTGFISGEAISTAASNGVYTNNTDLDVLETGAADKNLYTNNTGFTASTIIGPFSKVDGAFIRTTDPGTGDDINDGVLVGNRWVNTSTDKSFVCVDNTAAAAIWLQTAGVGAGARGPFQFYADQFENPNNADWTVNSLAPAEADDNNAGLTVRAFDDTTEEGVGFTLEVPSGVTSMTIRFRGRAKTGPTAPADDVGLRLYNRGIPDGAAVQAWSIAQAFAVVSLPATTEFFQYDEETFTLAALGVTAGEITQFELTRNPGIANDLAGDYLLHEIQVEWS